MIQSSFGNNFPRDFKKLAFKQKVLRKVGECSFKVKMPYYQTMITRVVCHLSTVTALVCLFKKVKDQVNICGCLAITEW